MNTRVTTRRDEHPPPSALGEMTLEQSLRRLPPPPVPATLERRLLEAIPAAAPNAGFRRWPLAAAAGVAAAIAVAASLHSLGPSTAPHALPLHTPVAHSPAETAPGAALPRADLSETRPCDILPPLPFSS